MFAAAMAGFFVGGSSMLMLTELFSGRESSGLRELVPQQPLQSSTPPAAAAGAQAESPFVAAACRYGLPLGGSQLVKHVTAPDTGRVAFIAGLNFERRVPDWVLEYFPPETVELPRGAKEGSASGNSGGSGSSSSAGGGGVGNRALSKFFSDATVPAIFRATNGDYIFGDGLGLSRGHLAPAQLHKESQGAMDATFNLAANIVPQELTTNGGEWFRLEQLTKHLRREFRGGMWVVTGPLFVPTTVGALLGGGRDPASTRWPLNAALPPTSLRDDDDDVLGARKAPPASEALRQKVVCYPVIGEHNVAVPTHLFKLLLGERSDGSLGLAAFVVPNRPLKEERPLGAYQVPLERLEALAGKQFFPSAPRSTFDICRKLSCDGKTARAPFTNQYRLMAQLRVCRSKGELEQAFASMHSGSAAAANTSIPDAVAKEYQRLLRGFIAAGE